MRRLALACVLIVGGSVLLAATQGATSQQQTAPPAFRASVDLVQLDVSVLDKNRQPVLGLAAGDFTILENGAPRPVEAFSTVDLPDAEATTTTAAWMRDVTPDVTTNAIPQTGRVFVIVMDDALMPNDLGAVDLARKGAASVIAHMGPNDLAAVAFTMMSQGAQGLTNDRTKLMAAVNSLSSLGNTSLGVHHPDHTPAPRCSNYMSSVLAVQDAADGLAALPGRRKAVIYFSGGMGVKLGAAIVTGPLPISDDPKACGASVRDAFDQVLTNAARANVAVYGVDPMGLRTDAHLDNAEGDVLNYLQTMSDNTGGHAIINTNDLEPGITQIFRESRSYYLLGYKPADLKADGSIKRLEVKVDRPDLEVVSRRMYYAPKPAKANAVAPPANLTALSNIVPNSDWPMRIAAMPVRSGQKDVVGLAIGLERPAPHDRVTDSVEVAIRAFTPDGDARGSFDETVPVVLPPSEAGATTTDFDVLAPLPLPPGRYQLRVSAHSKALDKRGSVYADVEVPDFVKAPLALSGVLVTDAPGVAAAPRLVLSPFVPVVPTSLRTFATTDHASAFVRIYQNRVSETVGVTIHITDPHDEPVVSDRVSYPAGAFEARGSVDLTYRIPMARLPAGDYLLTFEASASKATARRDVRFVVR